MIKSLYKCVGNNVTRNGGGLYETRRHKKENDTKNIGGNGGGVVVGDKVENNITDARKYRSALHVKEIGTGLKETGRGIYNLVRFYKRARR
jgi:hypothetical protein